MPQEDLGQTDTRQEEDQGTLRSVFDDLDGFMVSLVFMTAIDMDLFPLLKESGLDSGIIVDKLGLHEERGRAFLNICSKFGYLTRVKDKYSLSPRSEVVLGNYDRFKAYVENRNLICKDLISLPRQIREGPHQSEGLELWPFKKGDVDSAALPVEAISTYSHQMDASSGFWSRMFLDSVNLSAFTGLLDVGGGSGSFGIEVATRYPSIKVGVFDLPAVGELAQAKIKSSSLDGRVRFHPGDFLKEPLPSSFDVITLMRVCLDWQDSEVSQLLRRVYSALPSGGTALVFETMYGDNQLEDREAAKAAVRALTVSGKARSASEILALLSEAGFEQIVTVDTDIPIVKIVQGTKPVDSN